MSEQGVTVWASVVVAVVAAYAAIVSTIALAIQLQAKRTLFKVSTSYGATVVMRQPPSRSEMRLIMSGANQSEHRVTINAAFWLLPDKRKALITAPQLFDLPFDVEPRKNIIIQEDVERVTQGLKELGLNGTIKMRGCLQDAIGNEYKSKPIKFEIKSS